MHVALSMKLQVLAIVNMTGLEFWEVYFRGVSVPGRCCRGGKAAAGARREQEGRGRADAAPHQPARQTGAHAAQTYQVRLVLITTIITLH